MRKLLLSVAVFVIAGSLTVAGEVGPPKPTETDSDMPVSFTVGHSRFEGDYRASDRDTGEREMTLELQKTYIQANFAIADDFEAYWRIGGAELEWPVPGGRNLDSTTRPYTSVGVKGVMHEAGNVAVGPFANASFFSTYRSLFEGGRRARIRDMWDVNAGISAQAEVADAVTVYGGPFLYHSSARLSLRVPEHSSSRYTEENHVGAHVGMRVPIHENLTLGLEGRHKSNFNYGVSLTAVF